MSLFDGREGWEHFSLGMRHSDDEAKVSADNYHSRPTKGSRTFVCAVDGSASSTLAFETMITFRRKLDHICLFHAYSLEKETSLPSQFRNDELRSFYENQLIKCHHLSTSKFSFDWVDRKGRTVNEVLISLLSEYDGIRNPMTPTRQTPDFYFCGFSGRKQSHSSDDLDGKMQDVNLGSTADFAARNFHMPLVIAKKIARTESRCFVVGVDGSDLCKQGFRTLLTLTNLQDTIRCVHVHTLVGSHESSLHHTDIYLEYRDSILNSCSEMECSFESIIPPEGQSVARALCQYAADVEADFIAISPRRKAELSTVTEQVIFCSSCSVILLKV